MSAAAGLPLECPRCQQATSRPKPSEAKPVEVAVVAPVEDWQTDQRLKQIGRTLRTPLTIGSQAQSDGARHWLDAAHIETAGSTTRQSPPARPSRAVRSRRAGERRMQVVAWFALVFGLGLAAGGAGLMGMGMFGEYPIFWLWGVAVTLTGQAILIAGLIKVLVTLWGSNRAASRRLADMQQELAEVGRTAESILAQRAGGPSGFYGELARGASPTLLLANLKGQIDHLAQRLHHDV